MTREPQRLEWSKEPPDAEGVWLCVDDAENVHVIDVDSSRAWINNDSWIERDGFAKEFGYDARYARIAGPEDEGQ